MRRTKTKAWDNFWDQMKDCGLYFGQGVDEDEPTRKDLLEAIRAFQALDPSIEQIHAFTEACVTMHRFSYS